MRPWLSSSRHLAAAPHARDVKVSTAISKPTTWIATALTATDGAHSDASTAVKKQAASGAAGAVALQVEAAGAGVLASSRPISRRLRLAVRQPSVVHRAGRGRLGRWADRVRHGQAWARHERADRWAQPGVRQAERR
jgi:hypothetical protein